MYFSMVQKNTYQCEKLNYSWAATASLSTAGLGSAISSIHGVIQHLTKDITTPIAIAIEITPRTAEAIVNPRAYLIDLLWYTVVQSKVWTPNRS